MRLRLDIAYDGSEFHGWASQPGLRTIQEELEAWLPRLLRLSEMPKPADAADALALAICHVWRGPATNRIQAAVAARAAGGRSMEVRR